MYLLCIQYIKRRSLVKKKFKNVSFRLPDYSLRCKCAKWKYIYTKWKSENVMLKQVMTDTLIH